MTVSALKYATTVIGINLICTPQNIRNKPPTSFKVLLLFPLKLFDDFAALSEVRILLLLQ
jgi:hypothetical protein